MSLQAHKLINNMFIYEKSKIYHILKKEEDKAKNVHLTVQEFESEHKSTMKFSHDHNVRVVEPETKHFKLTHLLDMSNDGTVFVSLLSDDGTVKEDISVHHKYVIDYLNEHFNKSEDSLNVNVMHIHIDPLHRIDKEIDIEKITHIEGLDMKHLYDKHHGKHHIHKSQ